jgi:uncharacterized protein Smg (DUF494 family)
MDYRIFEIIRLIEEHVEDSIPHVTYELMEELIFEGYQQDEIEEAITWIGAYQTQKNTENIFELTSDFASVSLNADAYSYLISLVDKKIISGEYAEDLLNYCLMSADGDIDFKRLSLYEKTFKFGKGNWTKEALADLKASAMKKDC